MTRNKQEYVEENKDDLQWHVTKPNQGPGFTTLKTGTEMYENTVSKTVSSLKINPSSTQDVD